MMKRLFPALASLTVFMALPAAAQSTGDVLTGSGAVGSGSAVSGSGTARKTISLENIQQQAALILWESRIKRTENFREDLLKNKGEREASSVFLSEVSDKRRANREECLIELHKVSKITQFDVYADCYRNELELELKMLDHKRERLEIEAGITDDVRWLTMTRLDLLIDALSVVINALDSNVYESVEELQEAKMSLMENYRKPYWVMLSRVNADRLLTWVAAIMIRIEEASSSNMEIAPEEARALIEGLNCLSEEEFLLQAVLRSQELSESRILLADARIKLNECLESLRSIERLRRNAIEQQKQTEEEARLAEEQAIEDEKSKLSRRLQRRLNYEYRVLGESSNVSEEDDGENETGSGETQDEQMQEAAPEDTLSRRLRRRFRGQEIRVNQD